MALNKSSINDKPPSLQEEMNNLETFDIVS